MATTRRETENQAAVTAAVQDEWAEEVSIHVPRKPKGDDPFYYVCVNERRFQVPANGKTQTMPKPIAEILLGSLEAEDKTDEFIDSLPNNAQPI